MGEALRVGVTNGVGLGPLAEPVGEGEPGAREAGVKAGVARGPPQGSRGYSPGQ